MKKLFSQTPTITLVFYAILLFHIAFCVHAFYLFGFSFQVTIWGSYHPYILLLYTLVWAVVCNNNNKAAMLYIAMAVLALALPYLTSNQLISNTFGNAMGHLDLIFSTLLLIDYKRFFRK